MKVVNNKKGGERFLSPWMFFVWALIGVAIVVGVLFFYSAKIDVRKIEADFLGTRLLNCLVDSGEFNQEFLEENFDIFEKCGLDKQIIENGDYYFDVFVYEDDKLLKKIDAGVKDFELQYKLKKENKAEQFADCSEKNVYAFNGENEALIKILSCSNQEGSEL